MQLFGRQMAPNPGAGPAGAPLQGGPPTPGPLPSGPGLIPQGSLTARVSPGLSLQPGQVMMGQVVGKEGGEYLLRFGEHTMDARSPVPLRIGDPIHVRVRLQQPGLARLELLPTPTPTSVPEKGDLSSLLAGMKLPVSEEGLALARTMVEHGVPLTRENVLLMRGALAGLPAEVGGQPPQATLASRVGAAWFLQAGGLPVTPQNVAALALFLVAHPQLGAHISRIQGELQRLTADPSRSDPACQELLEGLPGWLGGLLLEGAGRPPAGKAARRLRELALQAGIERSPGGDPVEEGGGGLRGLRASVGGEGRLGALFEGLEGLEEHLRALRLINQARPEGLSGFYHLQVPLRWDRGESGEVWVRYRREPRGGRVVDPEDLLIDFMIWTGTLGPLACTLEVKGRVVHVRLGVEAEEVRGFIEPSLAALGERLVQAGWIPGALEVGVRTGQEHVLVDRIDFASLEGIDVQA